MRFLKGIAIMISMIFLSHSIYSQKNKAFTINPGENVSDVIQTADLYLYPAFIYGKAYFKDGATSSGRLNYHIFLDQMHFINPKGDTLAVDNEDKIKWLVIGADSFCYNQAFYQLLHSYKYVNLVKKEAFYKVSQAKIGGYGQPAPVSAIDALSSFSDGTRNIKLSVNEQVTLQKTISYFLIDPDNHVVPVSKKAFQKMFPKFSTAINNYTENHAVDFANEKDLRVLFDYIENYKL